MVYGLTERDDKPENRSLQEDLEINVDNRVGSFGDTGVLVTPGLLLPHCPFSLGVIAGPVPSPHS